jgi:hypothetical protein
MTAAIRQHPHGGHTIAMPVPEGGTARVYVGRYASPAAARLDLARSRARLEAEAALLWIRRARPC